MQDQLIYGWYCTTDDRRITKFDATMWYVINGTLQREFSFMLGVDADYRLVAKFDATMWHINIGTLQQ